MIQIKHHSLEKHERTGDKKMQMKRQEKSKICASILMLFSLLMSSCDHAYCDFANFDFVPIESLSISYDEGVDDRAYGIAYLNKIETLQELLDLSKEYTIDWNSASGFDTYFFENNYLYLVTVRISGNLLAGVSISTDYAICHIFRIEPFNEKLNNYAFAFSCAKDIVISDVKTELNVIGFEEFTFLKNMYETKI